MKTGSLKRLGNRGPVVSQCRRRAPDGRPHLRPCLDAAPLTPGVLMKTTVLWIGRLRNRSRSGPASRTLSRNRGGTAISTRLASGKRSTGNGGGHRRNGSSSSSSSSLLVRVEASCPCWGPSCPCGVSDRGKSWQTQKRLSTNSGHRPLQPQAFRKPAATGHCTHGLSTTCTCTQTSGRSHGPRCNAAFQQNSKESSKACPWRRRGLYDE